MPQATTTSVALGPVADLPGLGAQSAGPDTDQMSFDTLLRPRVRHAAAAPTNSDDDSVDSARNLAQPASTEEQPSPLEVISEGDDPSHQTEQSTPADVLLVESLAGLAAISTKIIVIDAPIVTEESTDAGDQVLNDAGELAPSKFGEQARSAIGELPLNRTEWQVPSAIGKPLPSQPGEQAPRVASKQAPGVPELSAAESVERPAAISETTAAPIAPIVDAAQSEPSLAISDAPAATNSPLADSRNSQPPNASPQHLDPETNIVAASPVDVATATKSASTGKTATTVEQATTVQMVSAVETQIKATPAPSPESSASGLPRLENLSPDTTRQSTTESHDQNNDDDSGASKNPAPGENPRESKTAAMELVAGTEGASAQAQTAPETTNQAPVASPTASSPAHAESHQSVATSGAATALASLHSSQIRLPADVLAQPAPASNRRFTPTINTKSLLTRVARAFAAAQERDGEIRLRLSPPELGSLRLDVRIQDGVMVARLQTETDAARIAIVENLPALRERLSDQGVRIERFDIDLMHRQAGGTPDQPGRQQPEAPTTPLRVAPAPRPRSAAPVDRPSPAVGSTGGLNVIV